MHGRVAVHPGGTPSRDTGRHLGLTPAVDLHPTFAQGGVVMFITAGARVEVVLTIP